MNSVWTEEDIDYLVENAATQVDSSIASFLTRRTGRLVTLKSVRRQRQRLGIRKKGGRGVCEIDRD